MAKDDPNSITKFDGLAIESDPIKGTTDTATGLCPPVVTQEQRNKIQNIHKYNSKGELISIRPGTIVYNVDNALEYYSPATNNWVSVGGGIAPGGDVEFNDCKLTGNLIVEKEATIQGKITSETLAKFNDVEVFGAFACNDATIEELTVVDKIAGSLKVDGNITTTGDIKGNQLKAISLELENAPTFNQATVNVCLDVNGDIDVTENVTVEGNIIGKQTLTILGNSDLNNLTTTGSTTLNTLIVNNSSTFSDFTALGTANLNTLNVTSGLIINNISSTGFAQLNDLEANNLSVNLNTTLNNLTVNNDSTLKGDVTANNNLNVLNTTSSKNLTITSDSNLNNLTTTGSTTLNNLTVNNNSTLNTLTVNNGSTLKGDVTANNNLNVLNTTSSKSLTISSDSNLNNLTTTGNTTLNNLTVNNGSTLKDLTVNNDSTLKGDVTANNNLNVLNTTSSKNLTITSDSNLNNLITTGSTTLNNLTVNNGSTLKDLTVSNGSNLNTLTVAGSTSVQDITLNKNPVLVNDLTTNKNITASSITASGALISNNTLSVTGSTSLAGTLSVTSNTEIQGKLNVAGDTTLSNATINNIYNNVNIINTAKTSQLTFNTTNNPNLVFKNNNSNFSTTLQAATPLQDISITLPNSTPTTGQLLATTGGANPTWYYTNPTSGGNVTGNANTTTNALALWGNNVGTILNSTDITIDNNLDLKLNSHKIVSLADPTLAQDASTKNYVDTRNIALTGAITGSGNLSSGNITTTLTNIIPSQVTGFDTQVRTSRLDQMSIPTSSLNLNTQKLINVLDPTSAQDASTKNYVDTRNIALTGAITGSGNLSSGNITTTLTNITSSQISDFFSAVNVIANNTISSNLRSGTVYAGDVGGNPIGNLTVTGAILTAFKTNISGTNGQSAVNITYSDAGYAPLVIVQWFDATQSSVANDIYTLVYRTVSNTTAEIYLEETGSVPQNGYLHILLVAPSIGSGTASQGISGVFNTILANALLTAKAGIDMNSTNIDNLALPTTANQAVNKTYADSLRFIPTLALLTTTGSFTVPAGITKIKVTAIGGGGGGAGGVLNSASGGGAGGGASIGVLSVTPGQVISYTIGAGGTAGALGAAGGTGGTTTFSTISATGGTGGAIYPGGTNPSLTGVIGGVGSGGDINLRGGRGGCSNFITQNTNNAYPASGDGGDGASEYGGKGAKGVARPSTNGSGGSLSGQNADTNSYGAGGSGACVSATTASAGTVGGTGAAGAIILEY
jgi:hypothetical protein